MFNTTTDHQFGPEETTKATAIKQVVDRKTIISDPEKLEMEAAFTMAALLGSAKAREKEWPLKHLTFELIIGAMRGHKWWQLSKLSLIASNTMGLLMATILLFVPRSAPYVAWFMTGTVVLGTVATALNDQRKQRELITGLRAHYYGAQNMGVPPEGPIAAAGTRPPDTKPTDKPLPDTSQCELVMPEASEHEFGFVIPTNLPVK